MKNIAWSGFAKTKKGRVVYERKKKHAFTWQRASRICYTLIDDDIPVDLRGNYYVRMRAGYIGYGYAMLRMYPEFAGGYIKELASGGESHNVDDAFAREWKRVTLDIVKKGLDYLSQFANDDYGYIAALRDAANVFAEKYYDFLFETVGTGDDKNSSSGSSH